MPLDLTIAIPARNEEKNLPGCLECIGNDLASRVVVIDSGSTDATRSIATSFGADVLDFKWDGRFPKKRNWFLKEHAPATKWVLFIDADEYVTEAFKKELKKELPASNKSGYWIKYTIHFMGRKLKGGYPLKKLALFQVGSGMYECIEEENWSSLDMEVHEHPVLNGPVGRLHTKIDHRDFRDVSQYILKHNEYAGWEAARYLKSSADLSVRNQWTIRQRIKYKLMKSVWLGPFYFLGSFIFMGGFLDGSRGLAFAILKMSYFNQVYCKIRDISKNEKQKASKHTFMY